MSAELKRILFVDDEPMVLEGLKRLLRSMRHEWAMAFAESGPLALELMAAQPFDVIVSDMVMPGMNGAELLNEVMRRYPQTVRLILSGHTNQELILKCVGAAHQFLSKPCEPESLRQTIARATAPEGSLQDAHLQKLVAQMEHIPSIPALYLQIMEKFRDPDASLDEVGQIIAQDLGMTATILKLVNSAFFGLGRQISDPADAASYLGIETLKALVLAIQVFAQYTGRKMDCLNLETLWEHSLQTAVAAKCVAGSAGANRPTADAIFVSGMLHDVGKLILAANFSERGPAVAQAMAAQGLNRLAAEKQVFGANHAEVGGYLLGLWGLPVSVVEAIALHHNPAASQQREFTPLLAVHIANGFVHEQQGVREPASAPMDEGFLAQLGLSEQVAEWRKNLKVDRTTVA